MRKGSDDKNRIYDPRESHGADNRGNRTDIADDEDSVTAEKPVYINDDNLPVRKITVTNNAAQAKLTAAEIQTDKNIRTGGLVYIGGLYRTITAVDRKDKPEDTGTSFVTINPAYDGSETEAQFVYALVVDHSGEGENSDGSIRNDDGDGLLESFSGSQTKNYSWEASFNSANIPDGPVEIHVVTFDQAGNIGYGYTKTRASNNAPRITKVMLGTDLNGNGKYDFGSGEFGTFYNQKDDFGNAITKTGTKNWDLKTAEHIGDGTASWKVKNGLAVIPEFVGGAGPFYYSFTKGTAGIEEGQKISETKTELTSEYLAPYKLIDSGDNDLITLSGTTNKASWSYSTNKVNNVDVTNNGGSLTLTNAQIGTGSNEDTDVYFRFTFWDSTEDSTPGFDTGYTILNLKVMQDLADNAKPNAAIKPFEWDGTGFVKEVTKTVDGVKDPDGSSTNIVETLEEGDILGTKTTTSLEDGKTVVKTTVITPKNSLYGASRANGHIELESDLIEGMPYGDDPKVSGKVTFHGTAHDDTRLSSIWFKFTDFTATGLTQTTTEGVTKYDAATTALAGYTQAAWYNPATASWENAPATMADSHWEFTASDSSFNQNGHSVDWYLSIDTAYIDGTVGLDKALSVIALDAASTQNASAASTTQTEKDAPTPYYSMDVVPYVSSLTTSLSDFQSGNPSVYDRTALGHYPVYMTHAQGNGTYKYETVEVNGFNLYGTKMKFENVTTPVAIGAYKDPAANGTYPAATKLDETKHYRVTLPADLKSGEIAVWSDVSGTIKSLNNLNNNDAKGKVTDSTTTEAGGYSGCYNRQPNGINNNRLTDDLVIDVWDFNSQAAVSQNNSCLDIMMKINPANGLIGFAFADGYKNWSMANGTNNSYTSWVTSKDFMQLTGFAYDSKGNSYGVAAGGESSQNTKADAFSFYTSRWGISKNDKGTILDTGTGTNALRIECTGETKDSVYTLNKTRFQSPSIATLYTGDENGVAKTNVYLAFYDSTNGEIRFRTGTLKKDSKDNFGTFNDKYEDDSQGVKPTSYGDNAPFQIIANNDGQGLGYAGDYLSLGVTSDNVLAIVWYDAKNKNLMFSYNKEPLTEVDSKNDDGTITAKKGKFETAVSLINNAGKYCQLVVAGDNSIHIAAYDNSKGDLKYVYIPYNSTDEIPDLNNRKVCTVDSYLSVGKELTIDVAGETRTENGEQKTYYIPHIGYNGNTPKKPRYAYLNDPERFFASTTEAGRSGVTDKDEYTGIWECTLIPTRSKLTGDNSKRRINVGVWKADVGTIKGKRVPSNYSEGTITFASGTSSTTDKKCYGNNTENAVLGYGVQYNSMRDYVETAQMR